MWHILYSIYVPNVACKVPGYLYASYGHYLKSAKYRHTWMLWYLHSYHENLDYVYFFNLASTYSVISMAVPSSITDTNTHTWPFHTLIYWGHLCHGVWSLLHKSEWQRDVLTWDWRETLIQGYMVCTAVVVHRWLRLEVWVEYLQILWLFKKSVMSFTEWQLILLTCSIW